MTSTTITARAYKGDADLQAVTDLLNLCDKVDTLDDNYSIDELRNEFNDPNVDAERDLRLWEDGDGKLIAFAETYIREQHADDVVVDCFLYVRIHPDAREIELEDAILAWGEARLGEVGRERGLPAELRSGAPEHYAYHFAILKRHGFEPVRSFFRMVRSLDLPIPEPVFPNGYTLRHVASSEDQERWVDAFNWSFIDHYNHHPRSIESHRHLLAEPAYHPERDLIAVATDGTVAAFAFCWIDAENNTRNNRQVGWVSMLGTRRGHRNIGLGKAMLLAALQRLKADGMAQAKLGVDTENPTGALGLYESVGFERESAFVQHMKRLS